MPYLEQTVTDVRPWSSRTFSLKLTRPENFDFVNGEFVTIGLRQEGKLVARAYSIVSTRDDPHLEFLSIHVPGGPLTSKLAQVKPGDTVWVNSKATGSLTLDHVLPGRHLYMLATGTGLAPFMSLVRDPRTMDAFEKIVLVHTVRTVAELAYREELEARAGDNFIYLPTVTREPFELSAALFGRLRFRRIVHTRRPAARRPCAGPRDAVRQPGHEQADEPVSQGPGLDHDQPPRRGQFHGGSGFRHPSQLSVRRILFPLGERKFIAAMQPERGHQLQPFQA